MISVFWSLMTDLFTSAQATRLFPVVAAGGSLGAVAGAFVTSRSVVYVGNDGLLLIAAAGFAIVVVLIHVLMREKARLRRAHEITPDTSLDHALAGGALAGFKAIAASSMLKNQAAFMLFMTWVNAVVYYLQTKIVASNFTGDVARTQAFADINLVVNIASAVVLLFGLGRYLRRFGVTSGLMANPVIMLAGLIGLALSPTLLMIRSLQAAQAVTQYAIARPCREMCFTVVEQSSRYKAKSVIDTVVYRFGDLSSIWLQTGLRALGAGMNGVLTFSMSAAVAWGAVALMLGRRYERLRTTSD
jgi:AAA family ATP:ADP antiporter